MRPKSLKVCAAFFLGLIGNEILFPVYCWALTGGPDQPEMHGFQPVGSSDMVDLFTGDFKYNIPLMDVGGYPVNLAYNSGVTMEEEASWVGLGWSLNPGVVNKQMRGIPDEFDGTKGDTIGKFYNVKNNWTVGLGLGANVELAGFPLGLGVKGGCFYNSYKGPGIEGGVTVSANLGNKVGGSLSAGLGFNSQSGSEFDYGVGLHIKNKREHSFGLSMAGGKSSRQGFKDMSFSASYTRKSPANKAGNRLSATRSISGGISYGYPTYVPSNEFPMNNESYSFQGTLGGELFVVHGSVNVKGYYTNQYLMERHMSQRAYGTLYAEGLNNDDEGLQDLNREKDIPLNKFVSAIALPYGTHDLFSVQGEGVSGQYTIVRGGGVFGYGYSADKSFGLGLGAEVGGLPNLAHLGADVHVTTARTVQKRIGGAGFVDNVGLAEGKYFSTSSEMNPYPASTGRAFRGNVLSYLTAHEAKAVGLDKEYKSYPVNTIYYSDCTTPSGGSAAIESISRVTKPNHHLSELMVNNTDGMRYVYGLPAYVKKHVEASFRVDKNTVDPEGTFYTTYSSTDNSLNNNNGEDNFFEKQMMPQYAHSFLLTGILSPDYVDMTGDGISDDDRGTAVKLNYSRTSEDYRYRTPLGANQANYQEGLYASDVDQRANYVYGEKELWYMHSIESKTSVAFFYVSDRYDSRGVAGENGDIALLSETTQSVKRLDSIAVYSKADLRDGSNPIPIKTVHFEYDYSLCSGVLNKTAGGAGTGKLTLKKIYFTYGKNRRGKMNGYEFSYKNSYNGGASYFAYDQQHIDKWGNYQNTSSIAGYPNSNLFPYTLQDEALQNEFAAAWSLNEIVLPSGGKISVTYESDDYAYVENLQAGQMFFVKGFGPNANTVTSDLYSSVSTPHSYVFFEPTYPVSNAAELYERYLKDLNHKLYFTCKVTLVDSKYEYIRGYAEFGSDYGITVVGGDSLCYIKLDNVNNDGVSLQPVTLAALQTLRLDLPELAYDIPQPSLSDPVSFIPTFKASIQAIKYEFNDYNIIAVGDGKCKAVACDKRSWIRLGNPSYKKFGGGARVKAVAINDNWASTGYGNDFTYGTEYSYTLEDSVLGTISSGVANWEPALGSDELLRKRPNNYQEVVKGAPNNFYYVEEPMGESLFPAPVVGYSQVKVKNTSYDYVKRTATGFKIAEFHTAREFPTHAEHSGPVPTVIQSPSNNNILKFLKIHTKYYLTLVESFRVVINDMHGKLRKESVYNEYGELISYTKNHYKQLNANAPIKYLENAVKFITPTGEIKDGTLGTTYERWKDAREQETKSTAIGVSVNVETFTLGPLGTYIVPAPWPSFNKDEKICRAIAKTELYNMSGILEYVEKFENGSAVKTENLLYDSETGNVLLTRTTNEFDDPLYSMTYPAHWAYEGMGLAYKNIGGAHYLTVSGGSIGPVVIDGAYQEGDEMFIWGGPETEVRATVINSNGDFKLIRRDGMLVNDGYYNAKVIRSGRRNHVTANIATISSRYPAHVNNDVGFVSSNLTDIISNEVINANATLFGDDWKTNCTNVPCLSDSIQFLKPQASVQLLLMLISSGVIWNQQTTATLQDVITNGNDYGLQHYGEFLQYFPQPASAFYYTNTTPQQFNATNQFTAYVGDCKLNIECVECNYNTPAYWFQASNLNSIISDIALEGCPGNPCWQVYLTQPTGTGVFEWNMTTGNQNLKIKFKVQLGCSSSCNGCVSDIIDSVINPYQLGVKGNWRPERSYVYYSQRTPDNALVSLSNVRRDGMIKDFKSFWTYDESTAKFKQDTTNARWVWNAEITAYDQKGNEIENRDPLDRYSSALYGYNKSLATATASNAKVKQVAFDNFEDYDFSLVCNPVCNISQHWGFKDGLIPNGEFTISTENAHTGLHSIKVSEDGEAVVQRTIHYNSGQPTHLDSSGQYVADEPACLDLFSPDSGLYLLSAWVKEDTACDCPVYQQNNIDVYFENSTASYAFEPSGPVIDGWQRYESKFEVPASATGINIKLVAGSNDAYFDDIRIHPWYGNMKSFVYHPLNLRLMATLDENNFATFYEYDDEGNLIRVKKETERGIQTIKESRNVLAPKQ